MSISKQKIFEDYGCYILKREGNYYICYDSGESAGSSMKERLITEDEMKKAQKSEKHAYEVILAAENRSRM